MNANLTDRTNRIMRRALPLAVLLGLIIVVPVLAKYIGPDRTETIWVNRRRHCHYNAVSDPPGPGYDTCYMDLYTTPGDSCPSNVASYFNHTYCKGNWPESCADPGTSCSITLNSSIESCTAGQTYCRSVEQTVTHPPATISSSLNCPQTGDNGYCTAAASLSLSGNEPLSGYHIIGLEGSRNGEDFFCEGTSCTISLLEGANTFTFWALSDWGDSSEMGGANRGVDTQPPSVSASASGVSGNGSWYVSAVTIDASASDPSPGSGLASFQAAVDGSWGAYSGTITLNDGSHTVELLATDNAGWTDSESMSFQIDTVAPATVITNPTGTIWATGTITLSGVSSDLHLAGAEISYNGGSSWNALSPDGSGNWSTNWDTHTVANGSYSVRARGRDEAGNVGGSDSVTIMVDNGEPRIYIPDSWPIWQTVAINVVDNGIGVDRVRLTIHAGAYGERVYNWNSGQDEFRWDRYIDGISMPIGGYPVEVEAWDRVGNKGAAWGEIVIPAPEEVDEEDDPGVLSIAPPDDPPAEPPAEVDPASQPTNTPEPPKVVLFGEESSGTGESGAGEIAPPADSSNVLWGAAAAAAAGAAMIVVAAAKKKREDEEEQKAAAAEMFNKQQIALEEKQAQNAAQAKWEAEQEAARLEAEREAIKAEREAQGITTGQPAPPYFIYVEEEKERQREEDLRKRKEEEQAEKEAWTKVKEEKKISTYKPSFLNHADTYKDPEDILALVPQLKSPTDTKTIETVKFTFPGGLIVVGQTTKIGYSTNTNPDIWYKAGEGLGAQSGDQVKTYAGLTENGGEVGFKVTQDSLDIGGDVFGLPQDVCTVSPGTSYIARYEPDGFLNSTITLEFNHLDMSGTAGGAKISGKSGTFIKIKPGQALVYALVGVGIKLLSSIQFGEMVPAILEGVGIGG